MRVAQQGLQQSKERMVRAANKKRQHIEFFKGDLVLVSALHWPLLGRLIIMGHMKCYKALMDSLTN